MLEKMKKIDPITEEHTFHMGNLFKVKWEKYGCAGQQEL
jgi:hypothetical protein